MASKKKISLLIACYNEEDNIAEITKRIIHVFKKLPYDYEILFLDNGSTDKSYEEYKKLTKKNKKIKAVIMSRNFGSSQPSYIAGMELTKSDAIVLLHGDIQDPPEMIPEFIKYWEKGYDVVYGVRRKREGSGVIMNVLYKGFYFLLKKMSYVDIPLDAGDFSLIEKRVVKEILRFDEYDYYLRCIRAFVGFRQIGIPYTRDARKHGRSTETFFSGFWWAKTILINFSFKPLEWISTIAFLVMIFTFILLIINIVIIFVLQDAPRGIPTIVILILFLGGIQLLSLSIIAEYLAKIFLEIKHRPRYIVKEKLNLQDR